MEVPSRVTCSRRCMLTQLFEIECFSNFEISDDVINLSAKPCELDRSRFQKTGMSKERTASNLLAKLC